MSKIPNLNWLRTFESAARLMSFTAAGQELGMTQTAVSLQIKGLEQYLGFELFERRPRQLSLTEMGKAYQPLVTRTLNDLTSSTDGLFGAKFDDTVLVRVPISSAALWLAPRLKGFRALYPEINIRLISTIWADNATVETVDVDVRFGNGQWPGVSATKIADDYLVPISNREDDLFVSEETDMQKLDLIHVQGHEDHWSGYMAAFGLRYQQPRNFISVDTSVVALQMVASGMGQAMMLERYVSSAIQDGMAIRLAGRKTRYGQAHYLIDTLNQKRERTSVRLFRDWLQELCAEEHREQVA
ncbi:LysR family transcriptional regulator [Kiloniella sp. b19]|uniref:LysR family transcriptional regulator n=1 Tax=Kiloniella sp. GXU_MW_B19 TaxID=3141326 RepID=UPI0031D11A2A